MTIIDPGPVTGSQGRIAFAVLMLGLTVVFGALGFWQLQRLNEKEALVARVAERMNDEPVPFPGAADWANLDPQDYDYRPVTVSGRFVSGATVLVFTSLPDARGASGGPGYWVMTPLALEGGGTIFVNRGFVPQQAGNDRSRLEPMNPAASPLRWTGLARRAEEPGSFTPAPDTAGGIDWIRNPARLAVLAGIEGPVAPLYLDLPAGGAAGLPQGGETVVSFPNNHLGYAITWFGFALLTPVMLVVWLRRARRGR